MTSEEHQMLATVTAEVAALKAALVDPTIKSLVDGVPHTLGQHEAATNAAAYATRAEVSAIAAELAALKAEMTGAVTGLGATLKAVATKLGA